MQDAYRPTAPERGKCADLLAALRLPFPVYSRYRRETKAFLAALGACGKARRGSGGLRGRPGAPPAPSSRHIAGRAIAGFGMRRSVLFGSECLVGYANAAWLKGRAPGMDAIACPCAALGRISSPPLVLVPEGKEKDPGPDFQPIMEHEFVHVHQFLLGTFPEAEPDTGEGWLRGIFKFTRAEYEANFIQLVRWPRFFAAGRGNSGISLEDFCALRGYTQGLQKVFQSAAAGDLAEIELLNFLDQLPAAHPSAFRRIGLAERLGKEYAGKLPDHVVVTLHVLAEAAPGLRHSLYRPALGKWLSRRLALQGASSPNSPARPA